MELPSLERDRDKSKREMTELEVKMIEEGSATDETERKEGMEG